MILRPASPGKSLLLTLAMLIIVMPCLAQERGEDCPGTLPTRLQAGQMGQNTPGTASNIREQPSVSGAKVGEIPAEALFAVLDGPVCADGYAWWQVEYNDVVGWTVEGTADEYWTLPVDSRPNAITRWTAGSLRPLREFRSDQNTSYGLALSEAAGLAALGTGYPDNLIHLWDYREGQLVATFDPEYSNDARRLGFDDSGRWLAVGGMPGDNVQIWDVGTGQRLVTLDASTDKLAFRPGTALLAYVDFPRDIVLWDVDSQNAHARWPDAVQVLATDLRFDRSGDMLAVVEQDGTATLWDVEAGALINTFEHPARVGGADFSPEGEKLAAVYCHQAAPNSNVACLHLKVILWDTRTGDRGQVIDLAPGQDLSRNARLAFSPDGTLLALSEMARLWLFDVETGQQLTTFENFPGRDIVFTGDQQYLIGIEGSGSIEVWGLEE